MFVAAKCFVKVNLRKKQCSKCGSKSSHRDVLALAIP